MHEAAIALALHEQVLAAADKAGIVRITRVAVALGAARLVVPEALRLAWTAAAANGPADAAELVLTEVPLAAYCPACRRDFAPMIDDYRCPTCGRTATGLTGGDDIILTALTGEEEATP
jgi:hydrogenase nickel incorporation protein HypA/HybF